MNKKDKQKHQANYSDVGRPGYINLQLLIIILTLSAIIGITIGSTLYMSTANKKKLQSQLSFFF